jgi:tRNA(Ile)-lysidine synthase
LSGERSVRRLIEKIEKLNRAHGLICRNDRLAVALSGGPDSVALLHILSKFQKKYSLRIVTAHLNHGLQKEKAKQFESLSRRASQALGFPFFLKKVNLRAEARRSGRSLEEAGRVERYLFFKNVAKKTHSQKIVTAHTLDDQAETILMRVLRGSGLHGLAGIPAKRTEGRFQVIRPLLGCEKKELLLFLKQEKISFCKDPTNESSQFTRNRIRNKFLPMLEKSFNPSIKKSLANLKSICEDAQDFIEAAACGAFKKCQKKKTAGKKIFLDVPCLKKLASAVRREVLRLALCEKKGHLRQIGYDHLSRLMEAVDSPRPRLEIQLPGGLVVKKNQNTITFI